MVDGCGSRIKRESEELRVDGAGHFPVCDHNGIKRVQSPSRKAQGDRDFKAGSKIRSEERYPATQRQQSIVAYVDSTGAVSAEYAYDPFGKVVSHTGMDFDFQFSTKFYDPDIGMYYYGYRYYSPEMRRWASPDPIGEAGGLNLYGFCGNDGVNGKDKLGLFSFYECISIKSFQIRYEKAWWTYSGLPNSEKYYTVDIAQADIIQLANGSSKQNNIVERIPAIRGRCDKAYMLELTVEPSGGRAMFKDFGHSANSADSPCRLLTGRQIEQNYGYPRNEFRYWPEVTFSVGSSVWKTQQLWQTYNNLEGRMSWNSVATFLIRLIPDGSTITVALNVRAPESDESPIPVKPFGVGGKRQFVLE